MARLIERYFDDRIGNEVVDWMVLGAGVVMLGAALLATVAPETRTLAADEAPVATIDGA